MEAKCISCHKTKNTLECGICKERVCKNCAQFLSEGTFSYYDDVPSDLQHTTFCGFCYDAKIASELETYEQLMEKARQAFIFFHSQGKETRLMKRARYPIKVENSPDEKDAVLRLAFKAVKDGFNCVIDVTISAKKIRVNNYQSTIWSGVGIPAHGNAERLELHIAQKDGVPARRSKK